MQRLIIPVILILLLSFAFPGAAQPQRYSDTYTDSFDTVITFIAFADSPEVFAKTSAQVHSLYQHLHKLYDRYNSYEDEGIINVYTLNEKAAKEPVKVDPLLFTLLRFAQDHYSDIKGQTNIAMGKLLGIWHDYREAGLADPARAQLPPMEALQAAAEHCDIDRLILDSENMTVFFDDPEMPDAYRISMVQRTLQFQGLYNRMADKVSDIIASALDLHTAKKPSRVISRVTIGKEAFAQKVPSEKAKEYNAIGQRLNKRYYAYKQEYPRWSDERVYAAVAYSYAVEKEGLERTNIDQASTLRLRWDAFVERIRIYLLKKQYYKS